MLDHGRGANSEPSDQVPHEASATGSCDLVGDDELVEVIPLLRGNALDAVRGELRRELHTHESGKVSSLAHRLVDTVRNLLRLVPLRHIRHDLVFDPLSDFSAEVCVGLVEVWGVVLRFVRDVPIDGRNCLAYRLVPIRVGVRNQVAVRFQCLRSLPGSWTGLGGNGAGLGGRASGLLGWRRSRRRSRRSGLGVERTNLKVLLVLLEDALVVVFPELLGSVLAGNPLENCAGLVYRSESAIGALQVLLFFPPVIVSNFSDNYRVSSHTGMLILEFGDVVDVLVDNDPEAVCALVSRNLGGGESLGHGDTSSKKVSERSVLQRDD